MKSKIMDARVMKTPSFIEGVAGKLTGIRCIEYSSMDAMDSRVCYGVDGEELRKRFPHSVSVDGMGYHYMDSNSIIPILLGAVSELTARLEALEGAAAPLAEVKEDLPEVAEVVPEAPAKKKTTRKAKPADADHGLDFNVVTEE